MPPDEPPEHVGYELGDALTLLGTLEDARDALIESGHLAVVVPIETEIRTSAVSLASTTRQEAPMEAEPLRATEAARRMGIPTRELLRLVYEHRIRYVMVDGIAHVPEDAIAEYEAKTS
jgi:hypothetical protein